MAITGCIHCRQLYRPQNAPLTPCSACNTVSYCSGRCQNDDWAIHSQFCDKGGEAPQVSDGFWDNQGHYYCLGKVFPARTVVVTKFGESLHQPRGRYRVNVSEGRLLEEARNMSWEEFHRLCAKVRQAVANGGGRDALKDERWVQWILDSVKAEQAADGRVHNQTTTGQRGPEQRAAAEQHASNRQRATEQTAADRMAGAEQRAAAAQQRASEQMAAAQERMEEQMARAQQQMEEQMARAQQQMATAQEKMAAAQQKASEQMAAAAAKQAETQRKAAQQMAGQNQQQGGRRLGDGRRM